MRSREPGKESELRREPQDRCEGRRNTANVRAYPACLDSLELSRFSEARSRIDPAIQDRTLDPPLRSSAISRMDESPISQLPEPMVRGRPDHHMTDQTMRCWDLKSSDR